MEGPLKEKKTRAELKTMIVAELSQHDAPAGISFSIVDDGENWRPMSVETPEEIADHAEWIARAVQIADQLKLKYQLAD